MKIGAFAKKHEVKKSTVRYYVDKKLIVPKSNGTYPDFDRSCDEDMAWILRFRNMGFSIDEISSLLIRRRIEHGLSSQERMRMTQLLQAKKKDISKMIDMLNKQLLLVEEYNQGISIHQDKNHREYGVNFSVMNKLYCPVCKGKYQIENATLTSEGVNSGRMICECKHTYIIEDGVILQKQPTKAFLEQLVPLSFGLTINEKINDEIKNEYFVELKKTVKAIDETVSSWSHADGMIILNPRRDNFIFQLDQYLRKDGWYYLVHDQFEELISLREMMVNHPCFSQLIFIAYKDTIPIVEGVKYLFNVGGYGNDLAFGRKVWSIDLLKESLASIMESVYVDYGYYPTSSEYLSCYKTILPEANTAYEKNLPASCLMANHSSHQTIAIKVMVFKR